MGRGRGIKVVLTLAVAVLLSACTGTPPAPSSSGTPDPSPTTPETTEPRSRIGLTCDDLLPDSEVAAALGAEWEAVDPVSDWGLWRSAIPPMAEILQLGGLACAWSPGTTADAATYPGFQVWVLPDAEESWGTFTGTYGCPADAAECAGNHFVGGRWVEIVGQADATLAAAVVAAVEAAPVVEAADWPPAGTTAIPADCEATITAAAVREATGSSVEVATAGPHGGFSMTTAARIAQDSLICLWLWIDADAGPGHLERLPGGAWAWERVRAALEETGAIEALEVEGLDEGDSAWIRCGTIDGVFPGCTVDLIVGGNWLQAKVFDDDGTGLGLERLSVPAAESAPAIAATIVDGLLD